ncbi:DDE-type integrase/transposase/recombinase [Burkholderia glumae]|uniref:DDE-type integrase/transposase/recombinase n=1 Tax=Burkholderia glumae TaxID=337 RepID=UPI0035AC0283
MRWGDEINSALLRPPDYLDEIFVNRRGERRLRWRGLEERGAALAILLQKRRDRIAAKRFFQDVLPAFPAPRKSATGRLRSHRGCQGWHPGARQPQACIRDGRGPRDEARREPPSAAPRTRAMHAGDGRAEARPSARRALTEFTRNPSETGKWRPSPESASPHGPSQGFAVSARAAARGGTSTASRGPGRERRRQHGGKRGYAASRSVRAAGAASGSASVSLRNAFR